nr:aspartate aminotransferase family protein [Fodinibius sp.]NIY30165.1 aspartate aminotransferase family protein [Fodinibius sp.]
LEAAIEHDLENSYHPLCAIATIGTTGSTAIDPLKAMGDICQKYNVWLHVDAAFAGTALLLPEVRWMIEGIENADTFVFNPHKWMFTNFDCSAYFVKDKAALISTFEILPEYLKTAVDKQVNNYRDWGIQLGRRFRALKLWFVIRSFGVTGLQAKIRQHIQLGQKFAACLRESANFELLAPIPLNTVCFRYHPPEIDDEEKLNQLNAELLARLNSSGKLYLTHTKLNRRYTLRMIIGQTNVEKRHVDKAWELIISTAHQLNTFS